MPTNAENNAFLHALGAWRESADIARKSRELYRVRHAECLLASQQKTETARKADADIQTAKMREQRDADEVTERECYHAMIKLRGSAGEPERNAA
jgi:hypothetical protein